MTRNERLAQALEHAAHLLPAQGPIGVFVHHNTLHAFESQPFERAVVEAGCLFGAEPFAAEAEYRDAFARGRIQERDLDAVLGDADAPIAAGLTRRALQKLALLHLEEEPSAAALAWRVAEGPLFEGLPHPDPRALWDACAARFRRDAAPGAGAVRARDTDAFVHPTLIRLTAAFVDQGVAYWPMPGRERGLFEAARTLLAQPGPPPSAWVRRVTRAMQAVGGDATTVAMRVLDELGVPEDGWDAFVRSELLALPGWAGLVRQLELRPDRAPARPVPARLVDFLALRLVLEREARGFVAASTSRAAERGPGLDYAAFLVLAHAGIRAGIVSELDDAAAARLADELATLDSIARRRLWHLAYERRHAHQVLGALAAHRGAPPGDAPRFQAVFCIDERFESLRRHLEEILPSVETFGAAGFFGVAMYYQGIDDAHPVALCPIAITPQHDVVEVAVPGASRREARRRAGRRIAGRLALNTEIGSRTLLRGTALSAVLGMMSALPLIWSVLFPRAAARFGVSLPDVETRLALDFSVDEMTEIVGNLLEETGLVGPFSPIVLVVGHGSSSLNNPHESAHDCGACGGARGGANARAFADMANDDRVRERLRARGIVIPTSTLFIGGYHDTCDDQITYYDVASPPPSLPELRAALDEARTRDAHERSRRFESARLDLSPAQALRHVEARAVDLAQPRPEYGHATNAVAVIGRRSRTRGLFLDRRAFLVSYDSTQDADGARLARVLASVVPVGAGINLEYYFSYVDNVRYGAGTKLPHNITSLVGVMDGYSSDLRTGLPWQMVEIHEPVRLLVVVEATPELVLRVASSLPSVLRLIENGWVRLATLDPASSRLQLFRDGALSPYEPEDVALPSVASSAAWYGGQRGHLGGAEIRP